MRHVLAAIALAATAAHAGPLVPPVGPVAPTNKTLDQVRPGIPVFNTGTTINITTPGNYYLTENIASNATAILIDVPGVTLDLNGFTIDGTASTSFNDHGITISAAEDDRPVVIRNGFITNFRGNGVRVGAATRAILQQVHISNNELSGVFLSSVGELTAKNCSAIGNGSDGFRSDAAANYDNCFSESNGGDGFELNTGNLKDCVARGNTFAGFRLGTPAIPSPVTASHCVAEDNDLEGFRTGLNVNITHSNATNNRASGFFLEDGSTAAHCVANDNDLDGFRTEVGVALQACAARNNGQDGFTLGSASTARNCRANVNTVDGFNTGSDCRVTNSEADGNAAAGIRGFNDVVIDHCHVTDNNIGIFAGGGGLVIRCSAASNQTNYDMTNADHGPILDRTAVNGVINASNPFANVSH